MSHFAKITNGVVEQVIVAKQEFIDSLPDADSWVQTSYNTHGGIHYGQDGLPDGGVALRKNYAGIGFDYDAVRDAFIPPKPYASWLLNESTCMWDAPEPRTDNPVDEDGYPIGYYVWDEQKFNAGEGGWVLIGVP